MKILTVCAFLLFSTFSLFAQKKNKKEKVDPQYEKMGVTALWTNTALVDTVFEYGALDKVILVLNKPRIRVEMTVNEYLRYLKLLKKKRAYSQKRTYIEILRYMNAPGVTAKQQK